MKKYEGENEKCSEYKVGVRRKVLCMNDH